MYAKLTKQLAVIFGNLFAEVAHMSDVFYRRTVVLILLGIFFVQALSLILNERHIVTNKMLNEAQAEADEFGGNPENLTKLVNRIPLVSVSGDVNVKGDVAVNGAVDVDNTVDVRIERE